MKYKALRRIDTKEFVQIDVHNGNLIMYTCASPTLLNESITTIDNLKFYYLTMFPDSDEQPYFDEYEFVNINLEIIDN